MVSILFFFYKYMVQMIYLSTSFRNDFLKVVIDSFLFLCTLLNSLISSLYEKNKESIIFTCYPVSVVKIGLYMLLHFKVSHWLSDTGLCVSFRCYIK